MKEVVSPTLHNRGIRTKLYMSDGIYWICTNGLHQRFEEHSLGDRIRIHVVKYPSKHTITINLRRYCQFSDAWTRGRRVSLYNQFYVFLREANRELGKNELGETHFWVEVMR
jgi:hypothetical protein